MVCTKSEGRGTTYFRVLKIESRDPELEHLIRRGKIEHRVLEKLAYEVIEREGNIFVDQGVTYIWGGVVGTTTTYMTQSCSQICVGNGTATPTSSDTCLSGGSTACQTVDSGFPKVSARTMLLQATFGATAANFTWTEFAVANSCMTPPSGCPVFIINHALTNPAAPSQGIGTKTSGSIWVAQANLSIN